VLSADNQAMESRQIEATITAEESYESPVGKGVSQEFGQGEYVKAYPKPKAIYLCVGNVDGRKGMNGLIAQTQATLGMDPTSGDLYVFCPKNRKRLKMLYYWDGTYWLLQSWRLGKSYPWPMSEEAVRKLTASQFLMMLDGIDAFGSGRLVRLAD